MMPFLAEIWRGIGGWRAVLFILALVNGADWLARTLFPEQPLARLTLVMIISAAGGRAYGHYRARRDAKETR